MSAWQAAISSTRKAASMGGVHLTGWAAPGRYWTEAGTGGFMRACTRDRGRQIQTASESRDEGGGRGAPGHETGWHPFKEAPLGGNASVT